MENVKFEGDFQKIEIKGTPYTIVGDAEKGFYIVMGSNIVCPEQFTSTEEAEEYIEKKPYMLILTTTAIIAEQIYEKMRKEKTNA